MSDDLVKRARHFAQGCRGSMWQSRDTTIELMDKLADRIVALTAERDALRADECDADGCAAHISAFASQVDALTAQLAQRDAAAAAADDLADVMDRPVQSCSETGRYHYNWEKVDDTITAYRKARGQDETAKG